MVTIVQSQQKTLASQPKPVILTPAQRFVQQIKQVSAAKVVPPTSISQPVPSAQLGLTPPTTAPKPSLTLPTVVQQLKIQAAAPTVTPPKIPSVTPPLSISGTKEIPKVQPTDESKVAMDIIKNYGLESSYQKAIDERSKYPPDFVGPIKPGPYEVEFNAKFNQAYQQYQKDIAWEQWQKLPFIVKENIRAASAGIVSIGNIPVVSTVYGAITGQTERQKFEEYYLPTAQRLEYIFAKAPVLEKLQFAAFETLPGLFYTGVVLKPLMAIKAVGIGATVVGIGTTGYGALETYKEKGLAGLPKYALTTGESFATMGLGAKYSFKTSYVPKVSAFAKEWFPETIQTLGEFKGGIKETGAYAKEFAARTGISIKAGAKEWFPETTKTISDVTTGLQEMKVKAMPSTLGITEISRVKPKGALTIEEYGKGVRTYVEPVTKFVSAKKARISITEPKPSTDVTFFTRERIPFQPVKGGGGFVPGRAVPSQEITIPSTPEQARLYQIQRLTKRDILIPPEEGYSEFISSAKKPPVELSELGLIKKTQIKTTPAIDKYLPQKFLRGIQQEQKVYDIGTTGGAIKPKSILEMKTPAKLTTISKRFTDIELKAAIERGKAIYIGEKGKTAVRIIEAPTPKVTKPTIGWEAYLRTRGKTSEFYAKRYAKTTPTDVDVITPTAGKKSTTLVFEKPSITVEVPSKPTAVSLLERAKLTPPKETQLYEYEHEVVTTPRKLSRAEVKMLSEPYEPYTRLKTPTITRLGLGISGKVPSLFPLLSFGEAAITKPVTAQISKIEPSVKVIPFQPEIQEPGLGFKTTPVSATIQADLTRQQQADIQAQVQLQQQFQQQLQGQQYFTPPVTETKEEVKYPPRPGWKEQEQFWEPWKFTMPPRRAEEEKPYYVLPKEKEQKERRFYREFVVPELGPQRLRPMKEFVSAPNKRFKPSTTQFVSKTKIPHGFYKVKMVGI